MEALSRFNSWLGEKALTLYRLLKKGDKFYWSDDAKESIRRPQDITTINPTSHFPSLVRTQVTIYSGDHPGGQRGHFRGTGEGRKSATSATHGVLRQQSANTLQDQISTLPKYHLQGIHGCKEAAAPIMAVNHVPLSDIMKNKDTVGRVAKWAIKLLPFELSYKPRTTVKSQAIADFLVE